jgi:DNA-binding CsgD family transcriptional regulator
MVGRSAQLGELISAWAAPAARPRTVVVTGAAGVGKSTLVSAALDVFTPAPRVVLSGTARVHSPAPYDWLAAVLSGRDTDDLPVPPDALAWLAQHPDPGPASPGLRSAGSEATGATREGGASEGPGSRASGASASGTAPRERYAPGALLRLAVRAVRALVGAGPGVLVVEDLHALDPASLNLIGELAVVPDLRALIVVTSQPPDAAISPDVVARTLARLAGTPGAVRQHLGPLAPLEVAEFLTGRLAGPVPPDVVSAAITRTGGNPYLLSELVAAGDLAAPGSSPVADDLTAREREVLSCLAAGMSNKQVASLLGISIRTVAVHVSSLLRKTRSASRTEVALWAVRNGG